MKKILMSAAMFFAFLLILSGSASAQKVGGYKSASVEDERVVAAANFAVENRIENNMEEEGMEIDSINKAETQVVAGMNFRLCLTVRLGEDYQQIEALIYQDLKGKYALKSWTEKDCAQ